MKSNSMESLVKTMAGLLWSLGLMVVGIVAITIWTLWGSKYEFHQNKEPLSDSAMLAWKLSQPVQYASLDTSSDLWKALDVDQLPEGARKTQLLYGKELVAHTSKYLGPKGSVAQLSNGLNCQNCHLNAGTQPWGNNYGSVAATYPKFRARSGTVEDIYKRIADCFERSLNGTAPAKGIAEMEAMAAYIQFVGSQQPKGEKAKGSGIYDLAFMDRPADPVQGKAVYNVKCASCHGADGQGVMNAEGTEYTYPPLWGEHSYNHGAGLYRISRFAGYIKANMPLGATYQSPQLSDEQAWDLAAFVNSMDRPTKDISADWPDISKKNFDHPFGPFADAFSEKQHKYGPFGPIKEFQSNSKP